ncbi:MAG: riboflavin synthase subunit alpha [Betaproteobacteria bacterium SG8_40]|nr:MAG: riboflavin synthase subunit alpha [Betaproteobacteria bacterium SG8_40]
MFTGIIEAVGTVTSVSPLGRTAAVRIESAGLDLSDVSIGDSIAVSGVCLTVKSLGAQSIDFDVSAETLDVTIGFHEADRVNLEKSLRLDTRIGGHLVSGHVDAVGEVDEVTETDGNRVMRLRFPEALARFFARKGSVTVNGVSLTVNSVDSGVFSVNLIPHTLAVTNLGDLRKGSRVNLEIDLVARYVERMLGDTGAGT